MGNGHVHSLKDDLESFIYVILYAALRWLPVESSDTLHWWITSFFSAPRANGKGGGGDFKAMNAVFRRYTSDLCSTMSPCVVGWLRAAMDLHYKNGMPNPLWDDGEELKKMWEEVLAKDLPSNDRVENQIKGMKTRKDGTLHATYTSATSTQDLYRSRNEPTHPPPPTPPKRPLARGVDNDVLSPASQPSKRSRTGRRPQTWSTSVGSRRDEDLMTGVDSGTMSLGGTSALSSEGHTDE